VTRVGIAVLMGAELCLTVVTLQAQWQIPPQETADEVQNIVTQYCKMDAEGRWLGLGYSVDSNDLFSEFQSDDGIPDPHADVIVLEHYVVSDPREDHGPNGYVDYPVRVDYFEWGNIDSFLHFRWGPWTLGRHRPAWGKPGKETMYLDVYPTSETVGWKTTGVQEKEKSLPWSMRLTPMRYVSVDTAIRYVTRMRDGSQDPLTRYNASQTLATLASIAAGTPPPEPVAHSTLESSQSVAKRFVDLESGGKGLTPGGWAELAEFFAETPKPRLDSMDIVDFVGVGSTDIEDKADAEIRTNSLGHLDSSLRLTDYPELRLMEGGASACYGDYSFGFSLQLLDNHWNIAPDGTVNAVPGPLTWRIRESSQEPVITLATAIRYVRAMGAKATDSAVKRNAHRTLAILNLYRQYRPLPKNMLSPNSDGCG
jgi:hypothetical protein